MGSDASYNERRLLWKAVRLVWAVTGMRRTPRPMGAEEGAGSACRAIWRRGIPMGSGTFYNVRRLLWKVIRFV